MSPRLGTLPFILLSTTTKANSTTATQKEKEQYNTIFTHMWRVIGHPKYLIDFSTIQAEKDTTIYGICENHY
jgi:hypothetical protein